MKRARTPLAIAATTIIGLGITVPAAAQNPGGVVHRVSVLTELDAAGTPGASRVFTQLTFPDGGGEVVLPGQSTAGFRRLAGPAPVVSGDALRFRSEGPGLARMVAEHTAPLPVAVEVAYELDGESVDPASLGGQEGRLAVTYTIRNLTAAPTELEVVDGEGNVTTQTVDVAVPMVGSLSLTLPSGFSDITAPGAVVVGDGRGSTVVNWSVLLFTPIGANTQSYTWSADVRSAAVPEALVQILPVTPNSFGTFATTEQAYGGAVDSTTALTAGTMEIDANLRLLWEGASRLLAGLTLLRDGAEDLSLGLVRADDGATRLSGGLREARDGSHRLASGLGVLEAGAWTAADGADDLAAGAALLDANARMLAAGSGDLASGAAGLFAGLWLLANGITGESGLPAAVAGTDRLAAGVGSASTDGTLLYGLDQVGAGLGLLSAGIGAPAEPDTLRDGVAQVQGGLTDVDLGLQQLAGGISNPACDPGNPADPANPCGLREGVLGIEAGASGLAAAVAGVRGLLESIDASVLTVADQTALATAIASLGSPATAGTILNGIAVIEATAGQLGLGASQLVAGIGAPATDGTLRNGVAKLQVGMGIIDDGLFQMSQAIGTPTADGTLRNGVARLTAGVSNPSALTTNPTCDPTVTPTNPCGLLEGLQVLRAGLAAALDAVESGLGDTDTQGTLLWGADQVATGASEVASGAGRLQAEGTAAVADGASALRDGLDQLADGATDAATGGNQLAQGLVQLDEGAAQLAGGLADARTGSSRLADGLADARDGGNELADGADRLSIEGTQVLAGRVSEATTSSSLQLEQVRAAAARGEAGEGMPYPTAAGATATAVYQFRVAGVATTTGLGVLARTLIAMFLLGFALVAWPRRERVIALPGVGSTEPTMIDITEPKAARDRSQS
jgi:putative membrane protein